MSGIRVAILGSPVQPDVPWTSANVARLVDSGFNAVQLNIAWSYRPNDEPLNLEDVVEMGGPEPVKRNRIKWWAGELRRRAALARAAGLRTLLQVGVPFQGRHGYRGSSLPQCVSDPAVEDRYCAALRALAEQQPQLDDLLVYTYDQDAWLCSEFDGCPRCTGVPLHLRVTAFLNHLAAEWTTVRPDGRLWWEPWELSAGQALSAIPLLGSGTGLMVHSTIAEVISCMSVDVFVRVAAAMAEAHRIPLVVEAFLSCANEEVEPWTHLPSPLVTLHQLRRIHEVPGVRGVKEYYGMASRRFDTNARAATVWFHHPTWSDDEILGEVASEFAVDGLVEFWRRASLAYTQYPWDASWFARELGYSQPLHELTAATVRGQQAEQPPWETPAWRSTRQGVFMATADTRQHPWFLEDIGLRFQLAADTMESAIGWFDTNVTIHDDEPGHALLRQRWEAEGFVTRTRAYALHIRETLLSRLLRDGHGSREALLAELTDELNADLHNQEREVRRAAQDDETRVAPRPVQLQSRWVVPLTRDTGAMESAIQLLRSDPDRFRATCFPEVPDHATLGQFSLTSR